MVICLERGADLHMAQPMPLPLTVSCFTKIQIGFTFLVLAHPSSPGQRAIKRGCVFHVLEILRTQFQEAWEACIESDLNIGGCYAWKAAVHGA